MKRYDYDALPAADRDRCVYWSSPEDERISHETIDDAIEAVLDDWPADSLSAVQDSVSVVMIGWVRARGLAEFLADGLVENAIEALDEEYGDPDGGCTDITDAMREAEAAFIAAIVADYTPWQCEQEVEVDVPVLPWIRVHRPDWLEEEHDGRVIRREEVQQLQGAQEATPETHREETRKLKSPSDSDCVDELGPTLDNSLFQNLWTKAVGTSGYNKAQWKELEKIVHQGLLKEPSGQPEKVSK